MFNGRILVPVDRNETTARAVAWGLAIGDRRDAPVDLLHVRSTTSGRIPLPTRSPQQAPASAFPDETEQPAADGEGVSRHVATGVPHEEILRFASDRDVGLIVMGQDGKTRARNRLFDSVTDKVIRGASIPVLAVPAGDGPCGVEQILLPVGDRLTTDAVVECAAATATGLRTKTHVVAVIDTTREVGPFDVGGVTDEFIERLKTDARPALDDAVDRLAALGVETGIESAAVHGLPHRALDEYITTHDIDLAVAGDYGESRVARRILGDTTGRLLQTTGVPVLVA